MPTHKLPAKDPSGVFGLGAVHDGRRATGLPGSPYDAAPADYAVPEPGPAPEIEAEVAAPEEAEAEAAAPEEVAGTKVGADTPTPKPGRKKHNA